MIYINKVFMEYALEYPKSAMCVDMLTLTLFVGVMFVYFFINLK